MTSPLSISMPPSSAAPAASTPANTYTDLNGLAALKNAPSLRRDHQGRVRAGRGAVPADDAEEHARCERGGRRADEQRDRHVSGHVRQTGRAHLEQASRSRHRAAVRAAAGRQSREAQPRPAAASSSQLKPAAQGRAPRCATAAPRRRRPARISPSTPPVRAAGAADHSQRRRRCSASTRWACWRRRRSRPAGASACRAPPTATRASTCSASRRGASGAARAPWRIPWRSAAAWRSRRRTAFRAYGSIEESVSDFASLLASSPRYREAVAAGGECAGVRAEHRQVRLRHRPGVRRIS